MKKWLVTLGIYGPITVSRRIRLLKRKDIKHPFPLLSEITIEPFREFGLKLSVETYASSSDEASRTGLTFISLMCDVLSLLCEVPIYVDLFGKSNPFIIYSPTKRILERIDFDLAFSNARILMFGKPDFLRALGWYRKGKYAHESLDKYLALWNSIEIVSGKYHTRNEKTSKGIKNQIWQCFIEIWGDKPVQWEHINGDENWIDDSNEIRIAIAHGTKALNAEFITEVATRIPVLENVSHKFLFKWMNKMDLVKLANDNIDKLKIE